MPLKTALAAAVCLLLPPALAAADDDIATLITTAEYRLDLGKNTSVYKFYPDHTWEENFKAAVKSGAWRQTGPRAFSIGNFSFLIENNGDALRRSDRKTWRRVTTAATTATAPAPNLIPGSSSQPAPNYWCTWWSQSEARGHPALPAATGQSNPIQRDALDEQLVFGPDGWARDLPDARADLYLLLDDGWDVPYGTKSGRAPFGSCVPDPARWPAAAPAGADPATRLKKLNEMAIAAGWRGLALWIAVQKQGETGKNTATLAEFTDYWRERVLWCRHAGINYWKADWGRHAHDPAYRRAMTELARLHHPG
ncbi:MAG: hypothetical protein LBJ08_01890, partial [Bifidobacteriaceae bacterium]|nr:hypothetical protein [Bifidobacteriaceae bacterium]